MVDPEFLLWVKGPAFHAALIIFIIGMVVRLFEILLLGRKKDLAPPRGSGTVAGWRTIFSRSIPDAGTWKRSVFTLVSGYVFHIGLFIVIFLFGPHILVFRDGLGISWPGISSTIVDSVAVITMVTLLAVLLHRIMDPVMRFLSRGQDYLVWFVTFLPVLTGYLAFHRLLLPPTTLIAIHILSVELLLVVFPFTKLIHAFSIFLARWYNGSISGYRGVQS